MNVHLGLCNVLQQPKANYHILDKIKPLFLLVVTIEHSSVVHQNGTSFDNALYYCFYHTADFAKQPLAVLD